MRILILTPLFPPDTAPSAKYVKELTERLSQDHQVTTLLYGYLPEQVSGSTLINIDKQENPLLRLFHYAKKLSRLAPEHDLVLIQNGPSIELPCLVIPHLSKAKTMFMESDTSSLERTSSSWFLKTIQGLLLKRTSYTFTKDEPWPQDRPLIHPLKPKPDTALRQWHRSWETHLQNLFTKCSKI